MAFAAPLAASGAEALAGTAAETAGGAAASSAASSGAAGAGAGAGKAKAPRKRASTRTTSTPATATPVEVPVDVVDQAEPAAPVDRSLGTSSDTPTEALVKATRRVQPGQQVAGGLLAALVVYPVLLNFLKGGTPQVKQWARAKFFNGAQAGTNYGSASLTSPTVTSPATFTRPTSTSTGTGQQATGPPAGAATAIAFARAQIGDPYAWGGDGPDRWDCSGLVHAAYAAAGVKVPRTTAGLALAGVGVSRANLQPGDLVFPDPTHVGIYTGGGRFVEAPRTGLNVREVPVWGFAFARRVSGASA